MLLLVSKSQVAFLKRLFLQIIINLIIRHYLCIPAITPPAFTSAPPVSYVTPCKSGTKQFKELLNNQGICNELFVFKTVILPFQLGDMLFALPLLCIPNK